MNKVLGIGILLMLCACLWLRGSIASVKAERDAALRNEAVLLEANAEAETVIENMREAMTRDAALVIENLDRQDELTTKVASLERRLREALRHDATLTLDSVLPAAAADALCLQWHEASGRVSQDGQRNAAGGADAGAPHTAAAGRGTDPDCRGWRKMTIRDAVEWNGLLLRHAGLERLDKASLRRWAEGGGQ